MGMNIFKSKKERQREKLSKLVQAALDAESTINEAGRNQREAKRHLAELQKGIAELKELLNEE